MSINYYNKNSNLTMDIPSGMINYNGVFFPIIKIHLNTNNKGKIETQDLILKWFDDVLFVYDKLGSIELLETLKLKNEFQTKFTNEEKFVKFYLTRNIYIHFYDDEVKYVTNTENEKEKVVKMYKTGSFYIYETEQKNKLYIHPLKNVFKYNGLAMSKVN